MVLVTIEQEHLKISEWKICRILGGQDWRLEKAMGSMGRRLQLCAVSLSRLRASRCSSYA